MSMTKIHLSSEIEWQIVKYLWKHEESTVREIWENLFPEEERAYTTVQTYLERMVEKNILQKKKTGPVNLYSARISEKEGLSQATSSFVDKAFDGSFATLANFLIRSKKLKQEDIDELRKLLEGEDS
ncbi:MAG: hypothetical protein GF372_10500 [Candidatus Marinimicrobia bacterium]|nr:hypothetical protein [Candidatus Neomarinimicrobiota bacterium]